MTPQNKPQQASKFPGFLNPTPEQIARTARLDFLRKRFAKRAKKVTLENRMTAFSIKSEKARNTFLFQTTRTAFLRKRIRKAVASFSSVQKVLNFNAPTPTDYVSVSTRPSLAVLESSNKLYRRYRRIRALAPTRAHRSLRSRTYRFIRRVRKIRSRFISQRQGSKQRRQFIEADQIEEDFGFGFPEVDNNADFYVRHLQAQLQVQTALQPCDATKNDKFELS